MVVDLLTFIIQSINNDNGNHIISNGTRLESNRYYIGLDHHRLSFEDSDESNYNLIVYCFYRRSAFAMK